MASGNAVDVSCFFLFEASGDSEDVFSPVMAVFGHGNNAVAEDDAESCSCDLSDYLRFNELKDCEVQEYYDDDNEEVNTIIDQTLSGEQMGLPCIASGLMLAEQDLISRPSVDSTEGLMNEIEKNRRFWEACLAS